jgi:hypothetical protein
VSQSDGTAPHLEGGESAEARIAEVKSQRLISFHLAARFIGSFALAARFTGSFASRALATIASHGSPTGLFNRAGSWGNVVGLHSPSNQPEKAAPRGWLNLLATIVRTIQLLLGRFNCGFQPFTT